MATAAQVADRFELGRAVVYARLCGLVKLELLEHARVFHAAPGVYLATRSGLAFVDLRLPPAKADFRAYAHDLQLSGLTIDLENEFGCDHVLTEREIRALETAGSEEIGTGPRLAIRVSGGDGQMLLTPVGRPRLHFPDCVITPGSSSTVLAIELERTAKGRTRLRRILSAYVAARHVESVRYYVGSQRVRQLVEEEVNHLKAQDLIQVEECPDRQSTTQPVAA